MLSASLNKTFPSFHRAMFPAKQNGPVFNIFHVWFPTIYTCNETILCRPLLEMFYLTMDSTHLWLYSIWHMVKDHSDSEKKKQPFHHFMDYYFWSFVCTNPQCSTYHSLCCGHWLQGSYTYLNFGKLFSNTWKSWKMVMFALCPGN